jgi:dihydrofolate reductase
MEFGGPIAYIDALFVRADRRRHRAVRAGLDALPWIGSAAGVARVRVRLSMSHKESRVTIHMVASLDGFIARKDGRVDWLETPDEFADGETLAPEFVQAFLKTIDCYVMGSRTYETALDFEARGFGWSYGDTPTFVLTRRPLPKTRATVEFYSGDLARLVNERLKPSFRSIWFAGGGAVSGECLRRGLADEVRYSIVPVLIGDGIPFFAGLDTDVGLHLVEVKAYTSGMAALRYEVRK